MHRVSPGLALAVLCACATACGDDEPTPTPSDDAGIDASDVADGGDPDGDPGVDTGTDVATDTAADTGTDTNTDAGADASADADPDGSLDATDGGTDTGAAAEITFTARVVDQHDDPISGAVLVFDGTDATTTDADGFAEALVLDDDGVIRVTLAAPDVATVVRTVIVDGTDASLNAVMLASQVIALDSADDVSVVTDDGTGVQLAGQFVDDAGDPVDGSVDMTVATAVAASALRALPPAPRGVDALLGADITFAQGDAAVDFDGVARVRWPLPADLTAADLDDATLRYFDDATQLWVDGGDLFVQDGVVTASVDHFTTWAVQRGGPLGCLDLTLTVDGAAPQRPVTVTATPTTGRGTQVRTFTLGELADGDLCLEVRDGETYTVLAESWIRAGDTFVDVAASATPVSGASEAACGDTCAALTLDLVVGDADGDGFEPGFGGDCNDDDNTIYPGAADLLDDLGVDANCDGIDGIDADGDGAIAEASGGNDCDDSRADVFPGRPDVGSFGAGDLGVDNDCDGDIDEDGDRDGDGFLSAAYGGRDCNDGNSDINPDATDIEDNGVDEDCDGADAGAGSTGTWVDADGDGYLAPDDGSCTIGGACDCDDANGSVYPGAPETCDNRDNDCDGEAIGDPDEVPARITRNLDRDGDGYGDSRVTDSVCPDNPGQYTATNGDDCNDSNPGVNPLATEVCDLADNDCNGLIDDEDGLDCAPTAAFDNDYAGPWTIAISTPSGGLLDDCSGTMTMSVRDGVATLLEATPCTLSLGFSSEVEVARLSGIVIADGGISGNLTVSAPGFFLDIDFSDTIDDSANVSTDSGDVAFSAGLLGDAIGRFTFDLDSLGLVFDDDYDGVPSTEDCNDSNPYVYPGNAEYCDPGTPTDDDCDGLIDEADDDVAPGTCSQAGRDLPVGDYAGTLELTHLTEDGVEVSCSIPVDAPRDDSGWLTPGFFSCDMTDGGGTVVPVSVGGEGSSFLDALVVSEGLRTATDLSLSLDGTPLLFNLRGGAAFGDGTFSFDINGAAERRRETSPYLRARLQLSTAFTPADGDDDGYNEFEDCDDRNNRVNPGWVEVCGDSYDNDCDPSTDQSAICPAVVPAAGSYVGTVSYFIYTGGFPASLIDSCSADIEVAFDGVSTFSAVSIGTCDLVSPTFGTRTFGLWTTSGTTLATLSGQSFFGPSVLGTSAADTSGMIGFNGNISPDGSVMVDEGGISTGSELRRYGLRLTRVP